MNLAQRAFTVTCTAIERWVLLKYAMSAGIPATDLEDSRRRQAVLDIFNNDSWDWDLAQESGKLEVKAWKELVTFEVARSSAKDLRAVVKTILEFTARTEGGEKVHVISGREAAELARFFERLETAIDAKEESK